MEHTVKVEEGTAVAAEAVLTADTSVGPIPSSKEQTAIKHLDGRIAAELPSSLEVSGTAGEEEVHIQMNEKEAYPISAWEESGLTLPNAAPAEHAERYAQSSTLEEHRHCYSNVLEATEVNGGYQTTLTYPSDGQFEGDEVMLYPESLRELQEVNVWPPQHHAQTALQEMQYSETGNIVLPVAPVYSSSSSATLSKPCCTMGGLMHKSPNYMRRNGFQLPLHIYQICAYAIFFSNVLIVYCFLLEHSSWRTLLVVLVSLTVASSILFTFCATIINPADPLIFELRNKYGKKAEKQPELISSKNIECDICGIVRRRSKHCNACNKCVAVFDHHCVWINNCVGRSNYRYFLAACVCSAVFLLFIMSWSVYVLISSFLHGVNQTFWHKIDEVLGQIVNYAFPSFAILTGAPCVVLILQLLEFHVRLIYRGETTYEFIISKLDEEYHISKGASCCSLNFLRLDMLLVNKRKSRLKQRNQKKEDTYPNYNGGSRSYSQDIVPVIPDASIFGSLSVSNSSRERYH